MFRDPQHPKHPHTRAMPGLQLAPLHLQLPPGPWRLRVASDRHFPKDIPPKIVQRQRLASQPPGFMLV
jgi:hypothetical protein